MSKPKYPEVNVAMVGEDGNAFAILGRARAAVREAGLDAAVWTEFNAEATSGDYDHLLRTVLRWFSVDASETGDYDEDEDQSW